jgi:amino acid adenylation domain-containing protein
MEGQTMNNLARDIATLSPEQRRRLESRLLKAATRAAGDQPIPRRAASGPCPLSFAQQRLWFLDRLEPDSPLYNIHLAFRLEGALDLKAFQEALDMVVARHDVLRTTFSVVDGSPGQMIAPDRPAELAVTDLRDQPQAERQTAAQTLLAEAARRPFDLARDVLLRATLVRLTESEHLLLLVVHHIAADGWSMEILFRELGACYEARSTGRPSQLPELPVQYADFADWQRGWLQGEVLKSQLDYWKQQLHGAPAVLELPTDRPRPAIRSFRGAHQDLMLPRSLSERLYALGRQEGTTLFMTLLAAFATLLSRYSGQEDIVVGSPIAGRTRVDVEDLIGFFVNTLALRTDLSGNPTFRELLARVRAVMLGAYAHQDLPFERLVEELQPERSLGNSPLFQVMLVLQNTTQAMLTLGDLAVHPLVVAGETAKFDLTLSLTEKTEGLRASLEYSTELFDAGTIERLLGHYRVLLEGVVAYPDRRVAHLPLLTKTERRQLLVEWNATSPDAPQVASSHELFEAQVERTPTALAVRCGDRWLSYRELDRQANQLAHHLRMLGVGPDTLVAVGVERSIELVVAVLGIWKAGGAYVPLDPTYPEERLQFLLEDSKAPVLVTTQTQLPRLAAPYARVVRLDADAMTIARQRDSRPEPLAGPDNLAYVLYTSGSTGRPKGVAVVHHGPAALLNWGLRTFTAQELAGMLFSTSVCFDLSVFELMAPLSGGGKVIIVRDALQLPECTAAGEVTFVNTVPSIMAELLRQHGIPPTVKVIGLAGEPLSARLVQQCYQVPSVAHVYNLYGPTEATVYSTFYPVPKDQAGPPLIGRPIAGTRAYVLDEQLQPVPIGVPGELYLGGAGLARGYLNRPELTAAGFLPDPFSKRLGDRLYRTGDRCRYRADGNLEFLGRLDNQVKVRGYRIEPGEIEAVLNEHPQVQETAVVLQQDAVAADKRLVAYVVPRGQAPALPDLYRFVQQKLPGYMVPAAFVFLERLPLTANGKIDRRALPTPDQMRPDLTAGYVAPRTALEGQLAAIWVEVLGVERVGIHDNFFELGGHSLMAMRVTAQVNSLVGVDLALRRLFEMPTIAALAVEIEVLRAGGSDPIGTRLLQIPWDNGSAFPLSFAQQRLWFLEQLAENSALYNMPSVWRIQGPLDVEALRRALETIIQRHEPLRTVFGVQDGEPFQQILPRRAFELPRHDFRHLLVAEREAEVLRRAEAEAVKRFDLAVDLPLRSQLLELSGDEHVLLLTQHHIASDGWSRQVLWREIETLYAGYGRGEPSPLPELPCQYLDYALWQRKRLQGERFLAQLDYWRKQLAGLQALQLPTDRRRLSQPSFQGGRQAVFLETSLVRGLRELSRAAGATLQMTLLAAFQVLLHRYSSQDDVAVGVPVAGRVRPELEPLIGFFVNMLVVRSDLSGAPTFRELVGRVRRVSLEAYERQEVPLEKLVEELKPQRQLGHHPLFGITFQVSELTQEELMLPGLVVTPLPRAGVQVRFDLEVDLRLQCVHALFEEQAARTPEGVAVICQDRQVTYRELNERANQLAHYLASAGVGPEAVVGILLQRSVDLIVSLLAVLKAGGAYLPLDPQTLPQRLAFLVADSRVRRVVSHTVLRDRLAATGVTVLYLDKESRSIAGHPRENPRSAAGAERLAYVMYTSGSTGVPKGVEIQHRAITRLLFGVDYARLDASLRVAQLAPISFDASTLEIWAPLLYGGCCVLFADGVPDFAELEHELRRHRVQTLWLTASLFNAILDERPQALQGLEQLLIGGEALSVPHVQRALQLLGPSTRLINGYGPTESTTFACCYAIPQNLPAETVSVPIGRPIANTRVYVLDRQGEPVPIGVPGELYLVGDGLARGYRNQPELTAALFGAPRSGHLPESRLYKTGDQVRWLPDGTLEFLGRLDQQVKLRGFRIELGEIEAVLGSHPAVRRCVVSVHADSLADKCLAAYWVAQPGAKTTPNDLRQYVGASLPDYMIPARFIQLGSLPMNGHGKVDRRALPLGDAHRPELTMAYVAPRNQNEEQLATIWAELLGVERVGIDDNFFELGGHSLLAVRLLAAVERVFSVRLPLATVFRHPTIAQFEGVLREPRPETTRPLLELLRAGEADQPSLVIAPSLFGEVHEWQKVAELLPPGRAIYGMRVAGSEPYWPGCHSLQDVAQGFAAALRDTGGTSPWHLVGFSFGGILAFEVARQLSTAGSQVGVVVVVDTGFPHTDGHWRTWLVRDLPSMVRNFPRWLWMNVVLSPRQLLHRVQLKARSRLGRLGRFRDSEVNGDWDPQLAGVFDFDRLPALYRERLSMSWQMVQQYRPSPYRGHLTLLRCRTHPLIHRGNADLGWRRWVDGRVEIRELPGTHDTVFSEPYINTLTDAIHQVASNQDAMISIRGSRNSSRGPPRDG